MEIQKESKFTFLVLVLISSTILLSQSENVHEKFTSAGISIAETTQLRMEPDFGAAIIHEVGFGTPFWISEDVSFLEGHKRRFWYKATLLDGKTIGWISSKQSIEGRSEFIDLKMKDLSGLYYSVARRAMSGFKEYDAAERLFNFILDNYPDHGIPKFYPESPSVQYVKGRIASLNGLAVLFKKKKEFHKAVDYYERILKLENIEREEIVKTKRNIMLLYKNEIGEKDKTIELCQESIQEYPDYKLTGFEWNTWVDIEAAQAIIELLSGQSIDPKRLSAESERILANNFNPPVILIATSGKIMSLIKNGDFEKARNDLVKIIQEYPRERRSYFKSAVDFSWMIIDDAIEAIIDEFGDYSRSLELIEILRDQNSDEELAPFLNYKKARLLDESTGEKDTVICYYEKSPVYEIWFPRKRELIAPYKFQERIERIRPFKDEGAWVSKPNAFFKPGLRSKHTDYQPVPEGTRVTILYKDTDVSSFDGREGNWAKVQLNNGSIGWIFDDLLSPTE